MPIEAHWALRAVFTGGTEVTLRTARFRSDLDLIHSRISKHNLYPGRQYLLEIVYVVNGVTVRRDANGTLPNAALF